MSGSAEDGRMLGERERPGEQVRRAFREFLAFPLAIMLGFVLLGLGMYLLERAETGWFTPLRDYLRAHVFGDAAATSDLLGAIAGSIITVASITFSILLLALQQSAATLSHQVVDQFLRRRLNQVYFGYFIGLALYTLLTLATVSPPFNPIFGATLALLLTLVALSLLLLLIYNTIHQMRPGVIVETIHEGILVARHQQLALLDRTRRRELFAGVASQTLTTTKRGYVVNVALGRLEGPLANTRGEVEVVLAAPIGAYVVFGEPLATVKAALAEDLPPLLAAVDDAIVIERERDIARDPAYGIAQLVTMAWTSVSTSKQNPAPGLMVTYALRDVLARWGTVLVEPPAERPLPVVYRDDVSVKLLDAFESLAVVATESMQHQIYAAVLRSFAILFERLVPEQQARAEELIRRILAGLGDLVLTADLDGALAQLCAALVAAGRDETAAAVSAAQAALRQSVGVLNSRATRVPTD